MLERRVGVLALLSGLFFLSACDGQKSTRLTGGLSSELTGFIEKVKSSQVFVEGGEFMMGDFGEVYGRNGCHMIGIKIAGPCIRLS